MERTLSSKKGYKIGYLGRKRIRNIDGDNARKHSELCRAKILTLDKHCGFGGRSTSSRALYGDDGLYDYPELWARGGVDQGRS